jgi:ankyrin repeat protein
MPKDTNLHKAALKGDVGTVQDLLDNGDDVNCRGAENRTPLHRAVGKGNTEVVQLLLSRNADVTLRDNGGMTPL